MGTLGSLAVSIVGDSGQMEKAFDGVKKKTQDLGKSMQDVGKSVSNTGKTMSKFVTGPIVAAGAGALGLAKKWASTGDEIAKTATKLGISTDALQEMDYWATQNGLSSASMERAVGRLNQRIGRAVDGNEKYEEAFRLLDVQLIKTGGGLRDTEDVMYDTIDALMAVEDPAMRSAYASEVFGTKLARDLMPALEDGSLSLEEAAAKAHELGAVMDEEAIRAAEDFEDAWDDTKRMLMGVVHEIGSKLLPIFTDKLVPVFQDQVIPLIRRLGEFVGRLIDWFTGLDPKWQKTILGATGLAAALGPVLIVVGKVITVIGAVVAALSIKIIIIAAVVAAIAGLVTWFIKAWNTNEEFRERVMEIWEHIKEFGIEIWGILKETLSEIWEALQETFQMVLERMQEFWDVWGETILEVAEIVWEQIKLTIETIINIVSDIIQLVLAIIRGDWEGAWEAVLSILETTWAFIEETVENATEAMRSVIELAMETIAEFWEDIWTNLRDWFFELLEGIAEFFEETWTSLKDWFFELLENVREKVEEIWSWIEEHILDTVKATYDNVKEWFQEIIDWATGAWESFRESMSDIWSGIVGSIKESVNSIIGLINSMIRAIEGGINNVISGLNSFIRRVNRTIRRLNRVPGVNISTVGTLSSISLGSVPGLARGGEILREGAALVGERGPELLQLPTGAQVKPLDQSAGKSVNIENHFHSPEPISPSKAAKLQEKTLRRLGLEWGLS